MKTGAPAHSSGSLPLRSAFNLRDLGGYATLDGRRVRHGLLYRSGTMALLTPEDEDHLIALNIATVCDLRQPAERMREPSRWCVSDTIRYHASDDEHAGGDLGALLRRPDASPHEMHEVMLGVYRGLPTDHATMYGRIFDRLADGAVPLLFNCAAGKDRTGVAAMLILHSLGVPRATILADYLATNEHADFKWLMDSGRASLRRIATLDPAIAAPLLAARAEYLQAAYDELDRNYGGVDRYLSDVLDLDKDKRARIQSLLLE